VRQFFVRFVADDPQPEERQPRRGGDFLHLGLLHVHQRCPRTRVQLGLGRGGRDQRRSGVERRLRRAFVFRQMGHHVRRAGGDKNLPAPHTGLQRPGETGENHAADFPRARALLRLVQHRFRPPRRVRRTHPDDAHHHLVAREPAPVASRVHRSGARGRARAKISPPRDPREQIFGLESAGDEDDKHGVK